MQTRRWLLRAATALGMLATITPAPVSAQGVTTGAIGGRVTDANGAPVAEVQVQVRNRATGFSRGAQTNASGRYAVLGLEVGSYDVTARRIGFGAETREAIRVTLSQTTQVDVLLRQQAAQLSAVNIEATNVSGALISPSRTGVSTTITDSALRRLPTLDRNFTDFARLTPQVSNSGPGLSGGGTNNRFNSIQIDGATESDLFGLGSTGQPGGQAKGKSIGIESVKEYQVLLSPYDVRQGNFAGVLINAVTKSGTNEFTGSAYGVGRNESFARTQSYIPEFEQYQYGFSLGGPIVKDKVLFFVNPEFQSRKSPASGAFLGDGRASNTVTQAHVDRFVSELEGRGMSDLGSPGAVTNENPLANIFGRVDVNLGATQLVLRHNYGRAEDDVFSRGSSGSAPSFPLSNNGYFFTSSKNATVAQVRTNFANGMFNEAIIGYTTIRDRRAFPGALQPQVEVTEAGVAQFVAGTERSSQANELDQDIFELTDNFTFQLNDAHRLTVGTQNQFYKVRNLFGQQRAGRWQFANGLDQLATGLPTSYAIGVPLEGDGSVRFSSMQYSAYVQDEWTATDRVRVSLGLRADIPTFLDDPTTNPAIQAEFGRNTADIPSGNLQWSPRLGVNWDVTGDQKNQVRGGVGIFVGRPAFVWMSNAYQNSGVSGYAQLTCNAADGVPVFISANVSAPPTQCLLGKTPAAGGEINLASKDLKFPQNLRATLGYDRDIGFDVVATVEAMYTRGLNNLFYENIALSSQEGIGTGANGRTVYGEAPLRPQTRPESPLRTTVLDVKNQSKDYAYSFTGGLTRRFVDRWEGSLFYTYSRAYDVQSLTSSTANSQYRYGRTMSGAHSSLELTPSRFDQPHRIVASGTYSFPTKTDVSLIYVGESGARYDYVAQADLNGDGFDQNDPVYVPRDVRDVNEILFKPNGALTVAEQQDAFESFIQGSECLRANRGRILPRNACQEPFTSRLDLSLRQSLPTIRGQTVSIALDVINFGNLLNKDWGQVSQAGSTPVRLLSSNNTLVGGTLTQGGRPEVTFDPGQTLFSADRLASNYQMQLSLRYSF